MLIPAERASRAWHVAIHTGARVQRRAQHRVASAFERSAPAQVHSEPQPAGVPNLSKRPGQQEELHPSLQLTENVRAWRSYSPPQSANALSQRAAAAIRNVDSSRELALWMYCFSRAGFFASAGTATYLGLVQAHGASPVNVRPVDGRQRTANALDGVRNGLLRLLGESLEMYEQDIRNVALGYYKEPWDWSESLKLQHRQVSPIFIAQKLHQLVEASTYTLGKRARNAAPFGAWLQTSLGPSYFNNAFHFQEDGWMSSRSAEKYEVSTETLFLGRQDSMHRTVLRVLGEAAPDIMQLENVQLLEIACGTGRQHTFVRDNLPTSAQSTLLDMSPFYLQEAKRNMDYWASKRTRNGYLPSEGSGCAQYVQGAAEALPAEDASLDFVWATYVTHEMPRAARRQMASEVARVLKPGGVFVLCDSVVLGDRPQNDENIDRFSALNEPFYRTFVREDFVDMYASKGLEPKLKDIGSATKALLFRKSLSPRTT